MPSSSSTWGSDLGDPARPHPDPDRERHRHRHDPGAGGLGAHAHLRHHGCRQLRARRALHAGRLCRRGGADRDRQLLGGASGGEPDGGTARRGPSDRDLEAADRPRPPDHDPHDLRHLAGTAELCALAVRSGGAEDLGAAHQPLLSVLSGVSGLPAGDRVALGRDHRRALAVPQIRQVRHLDPRHHAGPRHGSGHGHSCALDLHRRLRHRRRHGGGERRAVRTAGRSQPRHGPRLDPARLHRGGRGRDGESRRLGRRRDLHQPARGLCLDLGKPGAGSDRLLRGADPDAAVPAHGPLRAHTQMRDRHAVIYWAGFAGIVALLALAPLGLPEFWRRFLTEVLIWGLLAMSSDILIGYTGMVSFGHSAFFGLGVYGAAAALLWVKPPSLWLAILFGLIGAGAVALFVAYFSTRLRDIYFAITTLIFSQIVYVIIFTWTEVTGGENGLTFRRPALAIPGLFSIPFDTKTLHWFVLAIVAGSYLLLRRITQSPFGMVLQSIRENEFRTRAIGYPVQRYK